MSELLTVTSVLSLTNLRLVDLRRALGHRHDDELWWQARGQRASEAQADRCALRQLANLLHVERASARGRIHGAFATLEEQRAWLEAMGDRRWARAAALVGISVDLTLARLRAGAVLEVVA